MKKLLPLLPALCLVTALAGQAPIDTSKIGPQLGVVAPPFDGVDQDGVSRSLRSVAGRKGTMLVFFRSSDW